MVSYPGNFLRLLQEQCDAKSLLKRIQNLDKVRKPAEPITEPFSYPSLRDSCKGCD